MFAVPELDSPALEIPLFLSPAACGFPSPAQDYVEQTIDLNQLCVEHPAATFYVRASGHSMVQAPVEEVWGIGRRLTAKLETQDIKTVADLIAADPKGLRRRYGVVVERTVQELRGIPCADLEQVAQAKQQIICSRSFGERITAIGSMH